ncbi:MAG: COG4315 family predicted lipoprotein [Gaiellaceae bacterium]
MIRWLVPLMLVSVAGVGTAMAATATTHAGKGTVNAMKSTAFGTVLVSKSGRTLYRYTVDRKHVNRCTAVPICAKYWPALLVKAGAKPSAGGGAKPALLGTIKAPHGMRQVTYAGFPLYFFAGDQKAGQVKGQGFDKTWYVVNLKGALVKRTAPMTSPAPTTSTTPTTTTSSGGGGGETWG